MRLQLHLGAGLDGACLDFSVDQIWVFHLFFEFHFCITYGKARQNQYMGSDIPEFEMNLGRSEIIIYFFTPNVLPPIFKVMSVKFYASHSNLGWVYIYIYN